MGIEEQARQALGQALRDLVAAGALPAATLAVEVRVERPKRPEHGDVASNVALAVQSAAGKPPRVVAELLRDALSGASLLREPPEVAGPGFLNLRLAPAAYHRILEEVLTAGSGYGRAPAGTGERVLCEFVSANPTGPLLVSHGRGAIYGDGVARLLEARGHHVSREYYINDFGNQVRLFAASVRAADRGDPPPEGGYGGGYVRALAAALRTSAPTLLDAGDDGALGRACVARMLDGAPAAAELGGIRPTLTRLGVPFDNWYSEEALHRSGRVEASLAALRERGCLEARDGAEFFTAAAEGDDKDRVVRKSDGAFTYFAGDIAYHADKYARGYHRLLVVLGADHHGYEPRVRGAIRALGLDDTRFEVRLCQLVHLLRDGKPYKMGKRLGNLVTIDEVLDEIDEAAGRRGAGADALRCFYLSRRADSTIEIDIELAKRASIDNPVFYLQMGYARLCSILRRARERFELEAPGYEPRLAARVTHPDELALLGQLGRFPALVAEAASLREPHRVIFFLTELSQAFQSYFTRLKAEGDGVLPLAAQTRAPGWRDSWDRDKTLGRLSWIRALATVYGAGLALAGITALERMDPPGTSPADDGASEEVSP